MSGGRRWQRVGAKVAEVAESIDNPSNNEQDVSSKSCSVASVAIIGGGIAGLACARRLGEHGLAATVFDTGKNGPGGRASSRNWNGHIVDHAVQFVTCTHPEFRNLLATCGVARRWGTDSRFGVFSESGFAPMEDQVDRWVGVEGFGSIVNYMAQGLQIRQDVWVPPSNGIRYGADRSWSVVVPSKKGKSVAECFDAVVIAHNGKCAERLTSSIPAREIHLLLRTNFAASLPRTQHVGAGKFTLNQVYSLLFELPKGIMPNNFDAAFVENDPCLRWLSSNSSKFRCNQRSEQADVWTVLSTALFGNQHKVPQEALPGTDKEKEVIELIFRSIEQLLGLPSKSLQTAVSATKLQLWGAALPINRWASKDGADFVWSGEHKIGIAGDWFTVSAASPSSVEAAWLSGTHLADHIAGASDSDAGTELGENGGRFLPVVGDFGSGGSDCSAWVSEPRPEGMYQGKGYGGTSSKGSKGKNGHVTDAREQRTPGGRGNGKGSKMNHYMEKGENERAWGKGSGKNAWKGKHR